MAHDDHFHCYDHTGASSLHIRTDTFKRGTKGSPSITLYSLKKDLTNLAARSGGKATLSVLGSTPMISGGRDIMLLKLGTGFDAGGKPKVLFTGGLHAREWIGPTYVYLVAEWLIDNYSSNAIAKDIVDNYHLYFVPMGNPDGHEYTVTTYRLWRKNSPGGDLDFQKMPGEAESGPIPGWPESVDLNRNFDGKNRAKVIATGRGAWSLDKDDDTYIGSSGGSAKETQLLQELITNEKFDVVCDHHSYGCFVLHSPGDDERPLSNLDPSAGTRYATVTGLMKSFLDGQSAKNPTPPVLRRDKWTVSQASHFYATLRGVAVADSLVPGSIKDFAFYAPRPAALHRALCFTLELAPMQYLGSPGFELPEKAIRPVFRTCLGNSLALIKFATTASPKADQWNLFAAVP